MASIFKRTGRKNEPYTIQYVDHLGKGLQGVQGGEFREGHPTIADSE